MSNWVYLAGDVGPGSESGCGVGDWESGNCWSEGEVTDSPRERLAMLEAVCIFVRI